MFFIFEALTFKRNYTELKGLKELHGNTVLIIRSTLSDLFPMKKRRKSLPSCDYSENAKQKTDSIVIDRKNNQGFVFDRTKIRWSGMHL